ncbi:MAG: N-acyl homoserine lactonase family protein [Chloroflexota bacterium]|jgi:glyoxylase-like metal-dependent hydrolase (beta-lactamase superfamily II)
MPNYELYAVKYAERDGRRGEHFYGGDPHDGPMPMDYFVWAAVSPERAVVVDCGFTAETAARRGRAILRTPAEGLRLLSIDSAAVRHVILTHFHFDHIGNLAEFPIATFVVQDREMAFWTGRHAGKAAIRAIVEPEDILALVRHNYAGRLRFVDGSAEIVPGISVHQVGGHAPGLQVVTVQTARGQVVLASDATHYYANIEEDRPFRIVSDLPQMYDAFETVRTLAGSPDNVIPGHDPLVLARYPPAPGLAGIAARLA